MAYAPLYDLLPEIAEKETRSITVSDDNHFRLPAGDYGLVEMYCNDDDCDCRRVIIMVIMKQLNKPVAYISFGWESLDFYASWMYHKPTLYSDLDESDKLAVKDMHGIHLNTMSPQSEIAPAVMDMVNALCLQDDLYISRLKRHYKQFRKKISEKQPETQAYKIGRNDPCSCNSGKKFKKCCGR